MKETARKANNQFFLDSYTLAEELQGVTQQGSSQFRTMSS